MYQSGGRTKRRFVLLCTVILTVVFFACWFHLRFVAAAKSNAAENVIPLAFVDESFIRRVDLLANDLVVDPNTQTIYVSTPSSALQNGNSIVPVTPSTGAIGGSVFVGSEPGKMVISDNSQFIYVILGGAASIRRFDVAAQTAGLQFSLGNDSFSGPLLPRDIAVQPGSPDTLAVVRSTSNGGGGNIAIFDQATQRSTTLSSSDFAIAFNTSDASRLYGMSSGTLRRMSVNASGVTLAGTSNISAGGSIRFDNGRLYTSSGVVLNPETGTLFGTFLGSNINSGTPFTTDSTLNRAFYLTAPFSSPNTPTTVTLRVFDQQTFVPLGSLDIPDVLGSPTRIVRWGSNGLAFCTNAGQFFIIQSTLVSSADPIPTPTPTPTGTPTPTPTPPVEQAFSREVALRANDIVYDAGTQKIFASISSIVGAGGNSVTPIETNTASLGTAIFVGSEPNKLARSDDGQFLYVALDGAAAVRRVDIASQTAGLKFPVGTGTTFEGPFLVEDMEVSPGEPTVVAISRRNVGFSPRHEGVAIYDNGVQRTTTTPDHTGSNVIEYSASPGTLYGLNTETTEFGFRKMSVTNLGVTVTKTTSSVISGFGGNIQFSGGRIYFNSGQVIDPEGPSLLGTFQNIGFGHLVEPDASVGRAFFISGGDNSDSSVSTVQIRAFDINTFIPVGSISIPGVRGRVRTLIRWGANGLAFSTSGGQVFLLQSSLVAATQPAPTPTPSPTPSPTPTPTPVPTPAAGELRQILLNTNDLVATANGQTIFASVPSSVGPTGNSLAPIDPSAGTVGQTIFVGSEPNKLAISSGGDTIYVALDGANAVRKFDVASLTPGLQFSLGSDPFFGAFRAEDLAVAPGQSNILAVSRLRVGVSPRHGGVAIFDNGVQRQLTTPDHTGSNVIEFSSSPEVLYGQNTETTEFGFRRMAVAPCGVVTVRTSQNLLSGFSTDFKYDNGVAYSTSGRAVDPEAATPLGLFVLRDPNSFSFGSTLVLPDSHAGRVYFVVEENGSNFFRVFDSKTFLKLGEVQLPGVTGTLTSLIRWGSNGLAFRNIAGKVFLFQNSLIGGMDPSFTPAPLPPPPSATVTVNVSSSNGDPSGVTIDVTGSTTTSGLTNNAGTLTLTGLPVCGGFTLTPSKPNYIFSPASVTVSNLSTQPVFFSATLKTVGFQTAAVSVAESINRISVFVVRNVSNSAASVQYQTTSGTASDRADFNTTLGTLQFAPGETSKPINILLNNDTLVEGPESFTVTITDPTDGVLAQGFSTLTVNILDNDVQQDAANALVNVNFYVRQHYTDFLNREPDSDGLAFWTNEITSCGTDTLCREVRRINVSAAFFQSIEFQETGYLVYRTYKSAFNNLPGAPVPVRFIDFLRDSQQIGQGVQVGIGNWKAQLEANKQAYALAFVQRSDFRSAFPDSLTAAQYVDQLNTNAGGVLSVGERSTLIAMLAIPSDFSQRAAVLRGIADDQDLKDAELNKAFVLMQYFGYLRRDPNVAPDSNFDGWQFWLEKLNQFNGNFIEAEMVKAFVLSSEYQNRFGAANFQLNQ